MLVKFNCAVFKVSWRHYSDFKETKCLIDKKCEDGFHPFCEGWAICSDGDKFQKCFGRKISLERALEAGGFSKDIRRTFWSTVEEYGINVKEKAKNKKMIKKSTF